MSGNIGDDLFDFNHDGHLDDMEKAARLAVFMTLADNEASDKEDDLNTFGGETDAFAELEDEGLDYDELSLMDEEDRADALEEAGLDPENFDFF